MLFDIKNQQFYLGNKCFDFCDRKWKEIEKNPPDLIPVSPYEAIKKLQNSQHRLTIPIGIIGANKPNAEQYQIAIELGGFLAKLGLIIICGGRAGIMEAVCKGMHENNGISIGILPESNLENANKYVTIPLATGIGLARNAIIAASSFCLVAIGGSFGTMSEIAYGLQFGKKVFAIKNDFSIDEVIRCNNIEEIINHIYKEIFLIENKD